MALEEAMSQLPPQYGSILRLWVDEGLDLKEIQERSGLSIPAIKSGFIVRVSCGMSLKHVSALACQWLPEASMPTRWFQ